MNSLVFRLQNGVQFFEFFSLLLAPIMLTDKELIQNQPFELFQGTMPSKSLIVRMTRLYLSKLDGTPLSTIGLKVDELNETFQLNFVRFAFTPWIHTSNGYRRSIELQYISQVSRQDRKYKVNQRKPSINDNVDLDLMQKNSLSLLVDK